MIHTLIETEYTKNTPIEHRKKFAQFFTPVTIADLMADWLLANDKLEKVLEPAFGLGLFSRLLLRKSNVLNITGFEIDPVIFTQAENLFADSKNVSVKLQDYMSNDWDNKYDGIICNPPYFKFHDYDNKTIIKDLEQKLAIKLSGFTNLYSLFLLKSLYQLDNNGRAAYLIPSEFLNSDYGKAIKQFLIKNKSLRHIIVIHFAENIFADALTTSSLLLFANDHKANKVQFSNVSNLNELEHIARLIQSYPAYSNTMQTFDLSQLDPNRKWRAYYQPRNADNYQQLIAFSHYAKVVRGIATGANDYFVFNQKKARDLAITDHYLLPCICRAANAPQAFFTTDDYALLQAGNKASALLNALSPLDTAVKNYLAFGEQQGIQQRFLTASRKPWYALENRPPAPIWLTVFNRNGLRFIRNEAGVANLTCFHCLYPTALGAAKIDLLFAYLLTDIATQLFTDNSREYGNGLQKFEPNDINGAMMLDLAALDAQSEEKILHYYVKYRRSVLAKKTDVGYLAEINAIFLAFFQQI